MREPTRAHIFLPLRSTHGYFEAIAGRQRTEPVQTEEGERVVNRLDVATRGERAEFNHQQEVGGLGPDRT